MHVATSFLLTVFIVQPFGLQGARRGYKYKRPPQGRFMNRFTACITPSQLMPELLGTFQWKYYAT